MTDLVDGQADRSLSMASSGAGLPGPAPAGDGAGESAVLGCPDIVATDATNM